MEIDTSGILFIAAGAFAGIEDIVKARLGRRSTGFGSELKSTSEMGDLYEAVSAEDLHKFGMIPEFIGRTPVITQTQALDEDDLVQILTGPRNAITKQYRRMFQLEGCELEFEPEALHEIAAKALSRKTGARGLRSICEELLQQTMFDLPSEQNVAKVVVTAAAARGEEQPRRVLNHVDMDLD